MVRMGAILLKTGLLGLGLGLIAGCSGSWNNPYPGSDAHANVLYSAFSERPKHLDPARSYSSNEAEFTDRFTNRPCNTISSSARMR